MTEEKIDITVKPGGAINVDASGFQGQSCNKATAFIEQLGRVQQKEHKPEFYRQEHIQNPLFNK